MNPADGPEGNLKDRCLVDVLAELNHRRRTGVLALSRGGVEKKIYFKDGDAIFASSGHPDDRLGEVLLKAGKITVEQYDRSVEILKESGKKQGAILVELGYLAPKELFWGVKHQVREIILSLFHWEDGVFSFRDGAGNGDDEVVKLTMSMASLIYEGVKRIDRWTRMRAELPALDTVVVLNNDPFYLFQSLPFEEADGKVLAHVDGRNTLQEIMDASGLPSMAALKALYILWTLKIIVPRPEDQCRTENHDVDLRDMVGENAEDQALGGEINRIFEDLEHLSYYELLDLPMDAGFGAIKRAYYDRARRFHPDRHFQAGSAELKYRLTEVFQAVNLAYTTLYDPESRRRYDAALKKARPAPQPDSSKSADSEETARKAFEAGVREFKKGNYWGAADFLRHACRTAPETAKYWSNLALALSKIPNRGKEAEEALLTAIELKPFHADYFVNLGTLYLKMGLPSRAKTQFEAALTWDPENARAQKGLRQCGE